MAALQPRFSGLMSRWAMFVVVFAAPLALIGCVPPPKLPPPQVIVAHVLGKAANTAAVELDRVERKEGDKAIEAAGTIGEARAALAAIEERWAPIWLAFEMFAEAHGAYVDALQGHGQEASKQAKIVVRASYCALREATAGKVPLPDHPTEPCP